MKERLIEFLAYLGIGQTKFEEKVGLSRGLINNIKGGISSGTINKILAKYPELNSDWLVKGEGIMISENNQTNNVTDNKGIVGIQGNGNTIHNSPNDIANLTEMLKDKDYIIAKLRKQIEELSADFIRRLDEKDKSCRELLAEKDKFIVEMVHERNDIAKRKMDRESENLHRMDIMHEKLFELQNAIMKIQNELISLLNKMNDGK